MTHSDLNPVDPARPKRAAIVISNPAVSSSTGWPVGFWWSELTHPYLAFTETGKVTAALCHGTAILAFATLPDGVPLVAGRTVTGFPDVEEDLADRMTWEAGANFSGAEVARVVLEAVGR